MTDMSDVRAALARRLAVGEITEEDYDRLLVKLTSSWTEGAATTPFTSEPPLATELAPTLATPTTTNPSRRGFYFVRLWQGRISLASTYWIWGGLITGAIGGAARVLYPETREPWQIAGLPVAIVLWATFMLNAVFRSADGRSDTGVGSRRRSG